MVWRVGPILTTVIDIATRSQYIIKSDGSVKCPRDSPLTLLSVFINDLKELKYSMQRFFFLILLFFSTVSGSGRLTVLQ